MTFNRREFLKTMLVLTLSTALAACAKKLGLRNLNVEKPTRTSTPTLTSTLTPTVTPTTDVTLLPNGGPADQRSLSTITHVVIHHSDGPGAKNLEELKTNAQSYNNMHMRRDYNRDGVFDEATYTGGEFGYKWISYHFLVSRNGKVLPTQDLKYVRKHSGHTAINNHSIAICIDGVFTTESEKTGGESQVVEVPSDEQLEAAAEIIRNWQSEHKIKLTVLSHREARYDKTIPVTCPGNNIGDSTDKTSNLWKIIKMANSA